MSAHSINRKKVGFPEFIAGLFTKEIPKLERWKNK